MNPGQRIRPRSDEHPEHLVPAITSFGEPAPSMSFADGQTFLQRAAAQLEVGDQSEEQRRDQVAAMCEDIIRMSYEKAIMYDLPISEEMKLEYQFMNMSTKKLAQLEFRLSLTPTRLAARYIAWLHESIGTDAPNPLSAWLEELEAEIKERYPWWNPHRIYRGAEREVFALVGLYASALLAWMEDASTMLSLDVMATACAMAGSRLNPELVARLAEQSERLRVWASVLKIVERDYLKESVLPAAMRSALDSEQLTFSRAMGGIARERSHGSEARTSAAEARSRVKTLFANACASASLFHCHQQLLLLAAANLTYGRRRRDYTLMVDFLEQARGSSDPGNGPLSDAAASTKLEQADKQGA